MRIVVDINHPGHVHLFKNFISIMGEKGNDVLITASEKDMTFELLDKYNFEYVNLGSYGNSPFEKLLNIPKLDYRMYKATKKFNPDILLGAGSIRASHAAYFLGKPSISFEDTEHCKEQHLLYVPFTNTILTPSCFKINLGKKQIRYNGYHELAYLHPNYFTPDPEFLHELGLNEGDPYIVMRFVSWGASHDIGQHGIEDKVKFVKELEKYGRVFITSEGTVDPLLMQNYLRISPENFHNLLYYAMFCVGDGGTTAVESAILGTPSIYVSSLVGTMGNFTELEEKYGLIYNYTDSNLALKRAHELSQNTDLKNQWYSKKNKLLDDKIDVTNFMISFVENYL